MKLVRRENRTVRKRRVMYREWRGGRHSNHASPCWSHTLPTGLCSPSSKSASSRVRGGGSVCVSRIKLIQSPIHKSGGEDLRDGPTKQKQSRPYAQQGGLMGDTARKNGRNKVTRVVLMPGGSQLWGEKYAFLFSCEGVRVCI